MTTLLPESEAAWWCLLSSDWRLEGRAVMDTSPTTMPCFTLAAAKGRPSAPAYPYTPATPPATHPCGVRRGEGGWGDSMQLKRGLHQLQRGGAAPLCGGGAGGGGRV